MSNKTKETFALPKLMNVSEYHLKKEKIYSVNTRMLRELILESKKENVLIVFSAHWCSFCEKSMPKLKKFGEQNKDNVEIIFISSVDWLETNYDRLILDKYGFNNQPLLSIDIHEYGTEFMNWKRLDKFFRELIPDYSGKLSLPTFLLFDNEGEFTSFYHSEFKVDSFKLK